MLVESRDEIEAERLQLVDQVEEISLEKCNLKICTSIPTAIKCKIVSILHAYQDAFVWEEELPSQVDRVIAEHKLKVNPTFKPI